MLQPLEKGYITAGADATSHNNMKAHDYGWKSLNIKDPNLIAVDAGKIVYSGLMRGAGYSTILEIPSINPKYKYLARYVHNKKNLYKAGTKVKRGQPIAIGGKSGNSTGEHTHFELWIVPIGFDFTKQPYGATRAKYTVDPKDFINYNNFYFSRYYTNKKFPLEKYTETPLSNMKAVTEATSLNVRDYPTSASLSGGAMPKELIAVAKTSKIRGYEWIKCLYKGKHVYVASNWVKLVPITVAEKPCEPTIVEKIVEVIKEVPVEVIKEVIVEKEVEVIKVVEKIVNEEVVKPVVLELNGVKITFENEVIK